MGLRVEQGIRRSSKRILRLVPYESPALRRGENVNRLEIASVIRSLQAADAPPSYGFVNAKGLQQEPASVAVLEAWRAAQFPLGNHTFSHTDLGSNSAEGFEQDLIADEPVLKQYMGSEDWHWLRFPFLDEGDDPAKHRALQAFLEERGYRVAEVTLSFGDYAYSAPYARCVAKNDQQGLEQLKQSYLDGAAKSLERGRTLSVELFGRDITRVMLLHIGSIEAVMLPQLLRLLKRLKAILLIRCIRTRQIIGTEPFWSK